MWSPQQTLTSLWTPSGLEWAGLGTSINPQVMCVVLLPQQLGSVCSGKTEQVAQHGRKKDLREGLTGLSTKTPGGCFCLAGAGRHVWERRREVSLLHAFG